MGLYTGDAQGLRLEKGWQCGGWLGRRHRRKMVGGSALRRRLWFPGDVLRSWYVCLGFKNLDLQLVQESDR